MAQVTSELIKELREKTGAGMLDCKKALEENGGDLDKSVTFLREKGLAKAAKKGDRATKEGRVVAYIHGEGRIGVLVELSCETDFVAKTKEFEQLGRDICMQIAAANALCIDIAALPADEVEKEKNIYRAQLKAEGKPEKAIEGIVEGKIKKYYSQVVLLEQAYIKDASQTVRQIVTEAIAKFGENITISRFVRYQIGA